MYEKRLQQANALDFDDLIMKTVVMILPQVTLLSMRDHLTGITEQQ
jgi:superfamily I DNA/RNA helicase